MNLKKVNDRLDEIRNSKKFMTNIRKKAVKPIQKNTNLNYSSLGLLSKDKKTPINQKIKEFHDLFKKLHCVGLVNEYLRCFSKALLDVKVTKFNGDLKRARSLIKQLNSQKEFNVTNTTLMIKENKKSIKKLQVLNDDILLGLSNLVSLEDGVLLSENSICRDLKMLGKVSDIQHEIVNWLKVGIRKIK